MYVRVLFRHSARGGRQGLALNGGAAHLQLCEDRLRGLTVRLRVVVGGEGGEGGAKLALVNSLAGVEAVARVVEAQAEEELDFRAGESLKRYRAVATLLHDLRLAVICLPMKTTGDLMRRRLSEAGDLLASFAADGATLAAMDRIAEGLTRAFGNGGKLLTAGNGGSLADAMHVAEEFTGRFRADRKPLPAIALGDPTHMSCVANDFGFEHVFARSIEALTKPGDVVALFSTSGNSPSIVRAAQAARGARATVIASLGKGGGETKPFADVVLMAPGETSDRIQELHMLAWHIVIESVEVRLGLA